MKIFDKEVQLFAFGFLTLLLELILIRYLSATIWNLGYFSNLVVIAAFAGMGMGFIFNRQISENVSRRAYPLAFYLLLLLVVVVQVLRPVMPQTRDWQMQVGGELFFGSFPSAHPISIGNLNVLFLVWFLFVVVIFALISQRTAKLFTFFSPLKSYSLDIAGSCSGIVCFMLLSWAKMPAYAWFFLLLPMYIITLGKIPVWRYLPIALPIVFTALTVFVQDSVPLSRYYSPVKHEVKWSPYQKIDYIYSDKGERGILINGIPHQSIWPPKLINSSFYAIPYILRKAECMEKAECRSFDKALILGAGSGNDVVAALSNGVKRVDAVEIDPSIADIVKRNNPSRPYQDPHVRLVIDDGRSFMTRTSETYDLVVFALTDSLIKVSPIAQIRLENYLFTRESIERAYRLLNENGSLYFYNFYRQSWLVDKLYKTIYAATGVAPRIVYAQNDFAIISVSKPARMPVGARLYAGNAVFALSDSLLNVRSMAQIRMDDAMLTRESIAREYRGLEESGSLYFYNYFRKGLPENKLYKIIYAATGVAPRIVYAQNDMAIIAVDKSKEPPVGAGLSPNSGDVVDQATDDWPFLYLPRKAIPPMYLKAMIVCAGFIVLLMAVLYYGSRSREGPRAGLSGLLLKCSFVLMGISFLLLETKSIVQFSLLFGATWVNSSLVFLSVLLLVLGANWVAHILSSPRLLPAAYFLLLVSCVFTLLYPLSSLLYFDWRITRFLFASMLTFSPIFFANLIFSVVFRGQKIAEQLFGWNLLGAMMGGVLEYLSMAFGYNFLAVVVVICYTAVFVLLAVSSRLDRGLAVHPMIVPAKS